MRNIRRFLPELIILLILLGLFLSWGSERVEAHSDIGTNVTSTGELYYAWNDVIGWMDFHNTHNVKYSISKMRGWASSTSGIISLDCATSPIGPGLCDSSDYKVYNDGSGNLSGFAWNDDFGWISFCGGQGTANCPGSISYQVTVASSSGIQTFSGFAWNDLAGWISFNCTNTTGGCGPADFKVVADTLDNDEIYYAWNDILGWIDFNEPLVAVKTRKMEGSASSTGGQISLDCATSPSGDICDPGASITYKVINDGSGNLSGWGWNDTYGWFSFCGGAGTADCPGAVNYRVLIADRNSTQSVFHGYAWNDVLGWTSFNCEEPDLCDDYNYKVITSWVATSTQGTLESTTFDTGIADGAQLNSFFWLGDRPADTSVFFQFAASNASSGPWTFKGDDGTANSWYLAAPGTPIRLRYSDFSNYRYFRYKVRLVSNVGQTLTPRVDDVIVNWSP